MKQALFVVFAVLGLILTAALSSANGWAQDRLPDDEINGVMRSLERRMHGATMEAVSLEAKLVTMDKAGKVKDERIKSLEAKCGDPCKEPVKKSEESGHPTVSGTP